MADCSSSTATPTSTPSSGVRRHHKARQESPYHRNQFGGNVGGPIKHDKAFFFFSYAGLRQVAGAVVTGAIVPTAAERLGDFTADTFKVYNPKPAGVTTAVWDVPANQVMEQTPAPIARLPL